MKVERVTASEADEAGQLAVPKNFRAVPFAWHEELTVRIEKLTNNGCGLARVGEKKWVVFVHGTVPGELVKVHVFRNHTNYSEADLLAVLEPSAERVEPRCVVYGRCGGCQYQHLEYSAQLRYKKEQVVEIFERAITADFVVNDVVAAPKKYAYRSKITPHFNQPRDGKIGAIGFRQQTRRQLVDVERCEIAMEEINSALPAVRDDAHRQAAKYKRGATLLLRADAQGRVAQSVATVMRENIAGKTFEFSAGDFFQNNRWVVELLVEHVKEQTRSSGAKFLVDCYCGSGLFAVALADVFEFVWGVEVNQSSVAAALRNFAINDVKNGNVLAAQAEEIFAEINSAGFETAILIDPPRAGCSPEFIGQLLGFAPRWITYVSCHPATQMRDLQPLLAAGYTIAGITPFDMFPQTKHLECVVCLQKN